MKKITATALLVIALILGIYILIDGKSHQSKDTESIKTKPENRRGLENENAPERTERILTRLIEHADFKISLIQDYDESNHSHIMPSGEYSRYMTPSINIEIRNSDGQVIYKADQDNPFVGIKSIEGGRHVAINRGDGRFRVIDTETLEFEDLPATPPIERPIGFSWNWLDQNTLIGVAGIGFPDSIKQFGRCCDQHVVAASLLYLYDINSRSIHAVSIPSSIRGLVFDIGSTATSGHIELISSSGHEDDGSSLGWYRVSPK